MNLQRKIPPPSGPDATVKDVCRAMAEILGEGVDVHRCLAAQALGRLGTPMGVEPLTEALLDEDSDVRTDAAEALSKLADSRAGAQLLENLLGDPCTEVKLAAIDTLAKLNDKAVIPWLRRIVRGRDVEIAWDEDEFYDSGWDDWVDVQIRAVQALATLNAGESVPDIVEAMRDENAQDMTEAAFKALARMGKPGIDALAAFLGEESPRLRRRAAAALAGSDDENASQPLSRALADPAASVRMAAMGALAARKPEDGRLVTLFDDSDAAVRSEAVRLLGRFHRRRLPALLRDEDVAVQLAALAEIPEIPDDETLLEELRVKTDQGPPALAAATAKALGAKGPQHALNDIAALATNTGRPVEIRLGALQGLAESADEAAVQSLIDAMDDDARPLRLEAMSALARIAGKDPVWPNPAGTALLSALSDERDPADKDTPPVEARSAEPADPEAGPETASEDDDGRFPTSTVAAILDHEPDATTDGALRMPGEGIELTPVDMERLALARNIKGKKRMALTQNVKRHDDVRRFAARVLGDVRRPEVASALAAVLNDRDSELCLAAADSLARIAEHLEPLPAEVGSALMAAARSAKSALKLLLIRALAAVEDEGVGDLLRALLRDEDSFSRIEAVHALRKRGQAGPEVEALLLDPNPTVRLSAAEAVAYAGGREAIDRILDFAFSFEGYHGVQAARLLHRLNAAEASGRLIDVLRDPGQKRTWSVAIEALAELNDSRQWPVASAAAGARH